MIRPINVGDTIDFILKDDKDNPTIFIIGILDSLLTAKLTDSSVTYRFNPDAPGDSAAETKWNIAEQDMEFVRFGLKGIKNFKDKKGNDLSFKTVKKKIGNSEYNIVSDETLKYIPRYAIREIANFIAKENRVTEEQRKNS